MDQVLKCCSCGTLISQIKVDFSNAIEEISGEFLRMDNLYSQSVSFNTCLVCACKKIFCFNCSWKHQIFRSNYHVFSSKYPELEIPGHTRAYDLVVDSIKSISTTDLLKTSNIRKLLNIYANYSCNCYLDEVYSSIQLLEAVINAIKSNGFEIEIHEYLLQLGKLYFIKGESEKAIEVLAPLDSSDPLVRIKYWILVLNYIGPKYYQKNRSLLDEIGNTINKIRELSFDECRLRLLLNYTNENQNLEKTDTLKFYEIYFRDRSDVGEIERYYAFLDIARYDHGENQVHCLEILIHFSHVYFQDSIYLSTSYKLLSKFYRTAEDYEKALYFLEKSVESYIKTTPNGSPDIIPLLLNLAKLKIKFSAFGAEQLLLHALKICNDFHLQQKKLKVLDLLKIFYSLSFKSKLVLRVSEYIEHIKQIQEKH